MHNEEMGTEETICRICLKTCESFKAIEGNIKDVFDNLLPKIDLAATQEPVMCTNCADILIKCFDFKAACSYTHNHIMSFVNNKDAYKLDLKDVYLSQNENITGIPEDQDICGFCIGSVKNYSAIPIVVEKGDIMLKKMIEQCLPELDLGIIKNPVICALCHGSLEKCFHFMTNCLIVEEKIKKHRESLDLNSKDRIKLSSLLQFTMRHVTSDDGNLVDKIKAENQLCTERENADKEEFCNGRDLFKLEEMSYDNSEDSKNGVENKSSVSMVDIKLKNMSVYKENGNNLDLQVIKMEETFCGENKLKEEDLNGVEEQKYLVNEEIEVKTDYVDFNRLEDGVVLLRPEDTLRLLREQRSLIPNHQEDLSKPDRKQTFANKDSIIKTYQCESCSFQTKYKRCLNKHLLRHKGPSEVIMYKCDSCLFQTKHKENLINHLLVHKDPSEVTMYKCDSCSFETKHKYNLNSHLLNHKDPSEVTMYKCDSCSYQAKHKYNLNSHLLKHKDPSELTMYNCDSCSFRTRYNSCLKNHLLRHKDPSELTAYKCNFCSYQTKFKYSLKVHIQTHSQTKTYKCDLCSFLTKAKHGLREHMLHHKDPSEIRMYKCDSCSYQTKYRASHKKHSLVHKSSAEVTMYKCHSCPYQTKYKCGLKKHILRHPLEVMYKCDSCSFQTSDNICREIHLQVHKNPSEVTAYKCNACSYQTSLEYDLKVHIKTHSQAKTYKCDLCSFLTKAKHCLKRHMLQHKNPSEVTMYKCESCSYQTKYKSVLKNHVLVHKSFPEITMYTCYSCSYQTKYKCDLKKHIQRHPKIIYKCDSCSYQTKFKGRLKNHILMHSQSKM